MGDHSKEGTSFSFTGGVGSISATIADIMATATELHRIAALLDPLEDRLRSEWLWLGEAVKGAPVYPFASLEAMRDAWWGCMGLQGQVSSLATTAAHAAANYAETEERNANAVAQAGRVDALKKGLRTWQWGPFAYMKFGRDLLNLLETAKRDGFRDVVEKTLNQGGAYMAGAGGPGFAFMYLLSELRTKDAGAAGTRPALGLRKALDVTGFARPGHLKVRLVPAQEWDSATAQFHPPGHAFPSDGEPWAGEAGFEAMLTGSNDAYGYPPGSIGVVRVDRPDGTNAWVVHLPGTEDWSTIDSPNPFDMEGNMEALTAERQEAFRQQQVIVQELLKEALQAAGALPGADVLLTGHSGGGIHAAAAAADPAFLADVNVRMIVIAGSPAKNSAVGEGIAVLDLENENDIVTAADYGPSVPSRNWVTVTSRRPPLSTDAGLFNNFGQAHSLENYLADAAALDQSSEPAVAGSRETLRTILGAGGAGVAIGGRKWVYQGRDVDDVPPRKLGPVWVTEPGQKGHYRLGIR